MFMKFSDKQAFMVFGTGIVAGAFIIPAVFRKSMSTFTPSSTHDKKYQAATEKYLLFQNADPIGLTGKAFTPSYMKKTSA